MSVSSALVTTSFVVLCFIVLFLGQRVFFCSEDESGVSNTQQLEDFRLELLTQKAAAEMMLAQKEELEADIHTLRRGNSLTVKVNMESRLQALYNKLTALEQKVNNSAKMRTSSTSSTPQTVNYKSSNRITLPLSTSAAVKVADVETYKQQPVSHSRVNEEQSEDIKSNFHSEISQEAIMSRIRQTPECIAAVENGFRQNNFVSHYSQDWFVYMNFFYKKKNGFYVDFGAFSPKENSNTWFFDVCLGWKGICVEASADLAKVLRKERSCAVVNRCVSSQPGKMALQAPGLAIGRVVNISKMNEHSKVVECVTMGSIFAEYNVSHVDLMSLDLEGGEASALMTFPENDEISIDVILLKNERGDMTRPPCLGANLLRFPFFNREYGLFHVLGDDVWVKLTQKYLWNSKMIYPRLNLEREITTRKKYFGSDPTKFNEIIKNKLLRLFLKN